MFYLKLSHSLANYLYYKYLLHEFCPYTGKGGSEKALFCHVLPIAIDDLTTRSFLIHSGYRFAYHTISKLYHKNLIKEPASSIISSYQVHFSVQAPKIETIHPKETSYNPEKMRLANSNKIYTLGNQNPEKSSYIFSKESFSYILENGNRKKSLYFMKQNFLIF